MFHSFKIDGYNVDCENVLGKGQYGVVVECKSELESEYHDQLCAKLIEVTDSQSAQREADILNLMAEKASSNLNIVQVKKVVYYKKKRQMGVVMEKCQTNLQSLLEQRKKFSVSEVIEFLQQILNGYKLLDGEKIIHRDLKPENILINFSNKKPIYKIADFGVGKIYEENESAMTISKGTPAYAPPEINCLHQQKFGEIDEELYKNAHQICQNKSSVDIYSIGLILHQLLFGYFPFEVSEKGIKGFLKQLKHNPFKVGKTTFENQCITDLIEKMIVYMPSNRMTFQELYEVIPTPETVPNKKLDNNLEISSNSNYCFSTAETQKIDQQKILNQQPPQRMSLNPQIYANTCPASVKISPKIPYMKQQSFPLFDLSLSPQMQNQTQTLFKSDPSKNENQPFQQQQKIFFNPQQKSIPQQNFLPLKQPYDQNTRQELFEELKESLHFLSDFLGLTNQDVKLREQITNLDKIAFNNPIKIQQNLQNLKTYFVYEPNKNYSNSFIKFLFLFYYFANGKQINEEVKNLSIHQLKAYLTVWKQ